MFDIAKCAGKAIVGAAILLNLFSYTLRPAYSQTVDRDTGLWIPISLKLPVYKKWQASVEYQPRFQETPEKNFTESIVRLGGGYEFNKKFSLFGGAYWTSQFNPELDWENRLWEQATYTSKLGRFTLQNRLRLEQIERDQYESSSWRIRHQLRVTTPLPKSKDWYVVASEEPFFNLNSPENGPPKGFNQNRLFIGLGRKVNSYSRLEVGYLHQYKNNRGRDDLSNSVIVASLSIDLTSLQDLWHKSNSKLAAAPHHAHTHHVAKAHLTNAHAGP